MIKRLISKYIIRYAIIVLSALGMLALVGKAEMLSTQPKGSIHLLDPQPFSQEEEQVLVFAKAYDADESKQYLGKDLISKGVQPVQLTIQNHTDQYLKISSEGVDLKTLPAKKVAMKVTIRALPRNIAYKVAGFLFWPFMIPGTIDSVRTMKAHKTLKKDLSAKAIKQESILPYSTVHRVLFVPSDQYRQVFTVTLKNQHTEAVTEYTVSAT
jgi:hypothetical protein